MGLGDNTIGDNGTEPHLLPHPDVAAGAGTDEEVVRVDRVDGLADFLDAAVLVLVLVRAHVAAVVAAVVPAERRMFVHLGSGRLVASETEAPNTFPNLGWSGRAVVHSHSAYNVDKRSYKAAM